MCYMQPPVVRACCLGRNLMIHVPPGGLHDLTYMCYVHPGGAGLLIRPELSVRVPPSSFHDVLYAPPGGAGLLIRSEVMFYTPPGCLHDVSCAPRGLHNVL